MLIAAAVQDVNFRETKRTVSPGVTSAFEVKVGLRTSKQIKTFELDYVE